MSRFPLPVRRFVAVLTLLAVAVSACTGSSEPGGGTASGPDQWRRSVPFVPLTVPAEMVAATDRLDLGGLAGATGDRPAMVAAVATRPSGERYLRVSLWNGTAFQHGTITAGTPGNVQGVAVAGNATATALAGWAWENGTSHPFLMSSADRRSWVRVPLPENLRGYRLVAVDTEGGRIVALARDARGAAATVGLDQGAAPAVNALPDPPAGEQRELVDVAVSGQTLVVTGTQGPDGAGIPQAWRSTDGGRTWAEPAPISTHPTASVSGVTPVGGGFLATGAEPASADGSAGKRATAWYSPDGSSWTAEPLPEADGVTWNDAGAPTVAGEHVLVVASIDSRLTARLMRRQPTGEWLDLGETGNVAKAAGSGGLAVPVAEPGHGQAPGAGFVGIQDEVGLSVGFVSSGEWATVIPAGSDSRLPFFQRTTSAPADRWRATVRQHRLESLDRGGVISWWEPTEVSLTADAVTVQPWDPLQLDGWGNVSRGSSGGADVAIASGLTQDRSGVTITGWFRSDAGAPWAPVTGFGSEPWEQIGSVDRVADRWFAAGERKAQFSGGQPQAMIWVSTDGLSWTRTEGDFAQTDRASDIGLICTGPDGAPVAVGSVTGSDGKDTGALWTEQAGRWVRAELDSSGRSASFATCSTVGSAVVIDGTLGERSERWQWTPSAGFQLLDPPPVGGSGDTGAEPTESADQPESDPGRTELSGVQQVGGGYLASGRVDAAAYTGPVAWLSADGQSWEWIPIPVTRPDAQALVTQVDDDLIVLASSGTESRAWRNPDVASVIASIPKEG